MAIFSNANLNVTLTVGGRRVYAKEQKDVLFDATIESARPVQLCKDMLTKSGYALAVDPTTGSARARQPI